MIERSVNFTEQCVPSGSFHLTYLMNLPYISLHLSSNKTSIVYGWKWLRVKERQREKQMVNPFHLVAVSLTVTDNRVNIPGQRTLSLVGDVHNNNNNDIKLLSLWVWQDQLLEGIPAAKVTSAASVCEWI